MKGDYEEGVIIKSRLDGKRYRVKKIAFGAATLETESGAEIKMGISALELFFMKD